MYLQNSFPLCSLFSVTGSADVVAVCFVCLIYFIHLLGGVGEGSWKGSICILCFVAAVACVSVCCMCACRGVNWILWSESVTSHRIKPIWYNNSCENNKHSNKPERTLYLSLWLAAKDDACVNSPLHLPAAHAAAGQGEDLHLCGSHQWLQHPFPNAWRQQGPLHPLLQ